MGMTVAALVVSMTSPNGANAAWVNSSGAGLTLAVGLVVAIWSASGYIGAFGRAMNRIYDIDEGRPFFILRPINLALTIVLVITAALKIGRASCRERVCQYV